MTSGKQSKAQRRAESQRRAAEKRAAELRKQRMRVATRVGGILVALLAVVLIIVVATGGSNTVDPATVNPHVPTVAIPASMTLVPAPKTTLGPEQIPVPSGPKLATLINAATGQTIDGIQCQTGEKTRHARPHPPHHLRQWATAGDPLRHRHPGGAGRSGAGRPLRLDGELLLLAPHPRQRRHHPHRVTEHLGRLHAGPVLRHLGSAVEHDAGGPGHGNGHCVLRWQTLYKGNPRDLPLGDHYQIQLDVGTPIVAPVNITNWGRL